MADAHDGESRPCPECGRDAADRSLPKPLSLFHWRKAVPLIVPLIALVAFAVWLKLGEITRQLHSGVPIPLVVNPGISAEDLRRIADSDEPIQLDLVRSLADTVGVNGGDLLPGTQRLEVQFVSPRQRVTSRMSIGWPTPWYDRTETRSYRDVVRREGLLRAVTDPEQQPLGTYEFPRNPTRIPIRERWMYIDNAIRLQPPPEATDGAYVTAHIRLMAILGSAGFVVLAWWMAVAGVFIVNRFRKPDFRFTGRTVQLSAAAVALFAVIAAGIRAMEQTERMMGPARGDQFVPAGALISRDELRGMIDTPNASAALAKRILSAADAAQVRTDGLYLAATFQNEATTRSQMTTWNESFRLLSRSDRQFTRHPAFEGTERLSFPVGTTIRHTGSVIQRLTTPEDPAEPTAVWTLNLERFGAVLSGLALVWTGTVIICRCTHTAIVRRRIRVGRCGSCGYINRKQPGHEHTARSGGHTNAVDRK